LIEIPDPEKPGAWSAKYKDKLAGASKAVKQYQEIKKRMDKAMPLSRRNGYSLAVLNQINETQIYPAKLLLLLDQYDRSTGENRRKAIEELQAHVNSFSELRGQLEKVYAQSRILGNPEGYQLDMNVHEHLANGTNNTDWMFVYELPINLQIKEKLAPKGM
jgi:hexosaminidase